MRNLRKTKTKREKKCSACHKTGLVVSCLPVYMMKGEPSGPMVPEPENVPLMSYQ